MGGNIADLISDKVEQQDAYCDILCKLDAAFH